MKLLATFVLHLLINVCTGWSLLHILGFKEISTLRLVQGFVIGMLMESTLGFLFLMLGLDCIYALYILGVISAIYLAIRIIRYPDSIPLIRPTINFKILDWMMLGVILIKVFVSFLSWIRLPLYFDDAMTHWSGRARALYGKVNWSIDPEHINFLGDQLGYTEYPFLSVIWRANGATLNGSWNEIISRSDSFVFYLILLYSVYFLVQQLSNRTWVSLAAVILTTALPLEYLHATSGYCEVIIQALIILFLIALIRKEWVIAGLITSASIFTKNEGLILLMPLFYLLTVWNTWYHKKADTSIINSLGLYSLSTFLLVLPWLLFKFINNVPFSTPTKSEYYYHADSVTQFFTAMFNSPSGSIYWIMIFLLVLINIKSILTHHTLRMMLFLMISLIGAFFLVFCFTGANIFLANQMTIHRSLLQIAPVGIVLVAASSAWHLRESENILE